jgi:hypothetical protein
MEFHKVSEYTIGKVVRDEERRTRPPRVMHMKGPTHVHDTAFELIN